MNDSPPIDLSPCITFAPSAGAHIDPIKLLKYLDNRAILLAERTAKPGTSAVQTELLRGHRQEVLALQAELIKVTKNVYPTK